MSVTIGASAVQRQEKTYAVASSGKQIASNWIDFAVLAVAASITHLLSHDVALAAIVTVELIMTMMIWEGTRGETIGRLITGTRTVREECALTRNGGVLPAGMLLIAKKYGILLLCTCALGVGLIVEMCSSLFSSKAVIRRDWADSVASLVQVDIDRPLLLRISTVGAPSDSSLDFRYTSQTEEPVPQQPARRYGAHTEPALPPAPSVVAAPAPVVPVPQPAVAQESTAAHTAAVPAPALPVRPHQPKVTMRHAKQGPKPALPVRPPALPVRPERAAGAMHVDLPQRPASDAVERQSFVMYLEDGTKVDLPARGAIVIGRKPVAVEAGDGTVTVTDTTGTVSRSHARIEIDDGKIWITDLGSLNGTSVTHDGEERRLQQDVRESVEPGVRLSFGDMTGSIMGRARRRSA